MSKLALFAFNGEMACFAHALLNALDLHGQGHLVRLVVEGTAAKLAGHFGGGYGPHGGLFDQVRLQGLLAGVCRACAAKAASLDEAERLGLPIQEDMSGHAGMAPFIEQGYSIITFA